MIIVRLIILLYRSSSSSIKLSFWLYFLLHWCYLSNGLPFTITFPFTVNVELNSRRSTIVFFIALLELWFSLLFNWVTLWLYDLSISLFSIGQHSWNDFIPNASIKQLDFQRLNSLDEMNLISIAARWSWLDRCNSRLFSLTIANKE